MTKHTKDPTPPTDDAIEPDAEAPSEPSEPSEPTEPPELDLDAEGHPAPTKGRWALFAAIFLGGLAVGAALFGGSGSDAPTPPMGDQHASHTHGEQASVWTCSMHPQIRSEEPGQCPICGMDLIPVSIGDQNAPDDQVVLTQRARKLAEIRTSPVTRAGDASQDLRLLGRLDYAESKRRTVTAWTGGRIDRLHVDTTGEKVRRGQVIATIYSPEIYGAHQDLLISLNQAKKLEGAESFAATSARATIQSARQKLRLLGVPDQEITRMEAAAKPFQQVPIRSPSSGTIIKRLVTEGEYVKPGTPLYELAGLNELWVQLDAYESDLSRLAVGQEVELKVSSYPGEPFNGVVAFIDPVVDANKRTTRVRVQVDNPDGRLRPGMFAEAIVRGRAAAGAEGVADVPLVVPATAPLFSGRRSVVYVELPDADKPTYEAREVRLGPKMGDVYPVVAGLNEREHVVTHGAFALDADLQIRGGRSLMTRGDDKDASPFDEIIPVPPGFLDRLVPVVEEYLNVQSALAADDLAATKAAAARMTTAVAGFAPSEPADAAAVWLHLRSALLTPLAVIAKAPSLEAARGPFERLSTEVINTLHRFGNPLKSSLNLAFCPMAFDNVGAEWIQRDGAIDNSYFGERMRSCGEVRSVVPGGGYYVPKPTGKPAAPPESAPLKGHQH